MITNSTCKVKGTFKIVDLISEITVYFSLPFSCGMDLVMIVILQLNLGFSWKWQAMVHLIMDTANQNSPSLENSETEAPIEELSREI